MKKALHIAAAGIVALAVVLTCIVFPGQSQAATKKTTVTITSPVKVTNGKTGKYTLYQVKGEKATLKIKAKASSGKLKYKSSNESILKVSSKGVVTTTGKKAGTAVVTVSSSADKKAYAKLAITVKESVPNPGKFTIYLVRHGETVFNTMEIGQGWTDSPLTGGDKGGVAMAKQLGISMANIPFKKAYTSDLTRARETAEYIIGERKIPLILDKRLRETNLGGLEGKPNTEDEIGSQVRFMTDLGWTDVGGENMKMTADRVSEAIQRIISENKDGGTFLVTSHGGALIAFLDKLIGPMAHNGNMAEADPMFLQFMATWKGSMPNCAVSVVTYEDGKFKVESLSDTSYLGELAPDPNAKEEPAEYTFYLTRHGQTMFNVRGVAQGWSDSPLTKDEKGGVEMAKQLGKSMADIPFDKAYTSDLTRARETAEYIVGDRKIPIILNKDLRETNCGDLEGQVDEAGYMARIGWDEGYKDVNGESMHETADRFDKAIRSIIDENKKGGTFLVTSHGGAITAYLDMLVGPHSEKQADIWGAFMGTWKGAMPNCAVSVVKYIDGKFIVEKISDVSYLGDLAPEPGAH